MLKKIRTLLPLGRKHCQRCRELGQRVLPQVRAGTQLSYTIRYLQHSCCQQPRVLKTCTWGAGTCTAAAKAGKQECPQYLHEQGCPWHTATTYAAVAAGKLDCLQYAHERGCPWTVFGV
jgi:hypothetical protein